MKNVLFLVWKLIILVILISRRSTDSPQLEKELVDFQLAQGILVSIITMSSSLSASLSNVDFLSLKSKLPPKGLKTGLLQTSRTDTSSSTISSSDVDMRNKWPDVVPIGSPLTGRRMTNYRIGAKPPPLFSSRRMSAMLKSPSVRKHMAESLGLDPDSPDVAAMIHSRLTRHRGATNSRSTRSDQNESTSVVGSDSLSSANYRLKSAELDDRKRYRSSNDVTVVDDESGREIEHLLDMLSVGDVSPLVTSRDNEHSTMRGRQRNCDVTATGVRPRTFKMPTFDEFVQSRRSRSRDSSLSERDHLDDIIGLITPMTVKKHTSHPGLLSSFGGSFNELHRIGTRHVTNANFRCVEEQADDTSEKHQPGAKRREQKSRKSVGDCGDGLSILFTRRGSMQRSKRRPLVESRGILEHLAESCTASGDEELSLCSTSGDDNSASVQATSLTEEVFEGRKVQNNGCNQQNSLPNTTVDNQQQVTRCKYCSQCFINVSNKMTFVCSMLYVVVKGHFVLVICGSKRFTSPRILGYATERRWNSVQ